MRRRAPYAADPARRAGGSSRSRRRRRARDSSATATASSIPPPSAASPTRRRFSCYHDGDHFRTRLTHTIEVAQIARALARALALDDDLAEAVALAHDLGHTPFGHTGEDALDACMAPFRRLRPQQPGLRIVTELERRYADFDGLNLTQRDAGRARQTQWPAARQPRARRRRDTGRAACPTAIVALDRRLQPLDLEPSAEPRGAGGGDRRRHRL